jgi:hypothetical protein
MINLMKTKSEEEEVTKLVKCLGVALAIDVIDINWGPLSKVHSYSFMLLLLVL